MRIALILISLALSALFSGSETALITASRHRLENLIREKVKAAQLAFDFVNDPEKSIITTLVGNNISVVLCSSLSAIYLEKYFTEHIIVILSSAFLLIFGEILPKSIFRERANQLVIPLSYTMRFFYLLLLPIIKTFEGASRLLSRLLKTESSQETVFISRRIMARFVREGSEKGAIEEEKGDMLLKSICVGRRQVRRIMQPRTEIIGVDKQTPIQQVLEIFESSGLSQLVIYESDIDHIIGKIHIKDLFDLPESIDQIIRDILIVPETKSAIEMMTEFKASKNNVAIVIDEHGSTSGIITLEDIIEELFGEIDDEHDPERRLYRRLNAHNLLVSGRLEISYANDQLELGLPEGDYDTIGGMIAHELGRIPQEEETIIIKPWKLTIKKADKRRVRWVKMTRV
ncbi:HlyC/CorC family transporter [candidate division KSB1 bacterium]|nr:HlyC/CorC family transporter [candidate division KSB1 bacterium]